MDAFSLGKTCIIITVDLSWAFFGTESTGNTFRRIHIPGILKDLYLKVSFLSGDALHLTEGQKLNIEMPADLDQFGRKDSHGAIIGGKGLVQLRHDATDGRRSLHQIDIVPGVGQVQSRLHSSDASPNHHD